MKRLLSLTLALLMAAALFGAVGARNFACAEEDDPFVGLWEITGREEDGVYTSYADSSDKFYLDFLPNGAIYGVMVSGEEASDAYLGYKVTGENALDLYEGEDPVPGVYDPATGVITVTDTGSTMKTFIERVKADPLPDIRAMVDNSDKELTYYGYLMTQDGQTINMLEVLPSFGMDPRDFYLTLDPDGTGYIQLGSDEAGGDITWTDSEFTSEGESIPYTREGDHITMHIGEEGLEFAPEGEAEMLMILLGTSEITSPLDVAVDVDKEDLVGEWKLLKASAMGQDLTPEQIQEQGLDMSFVFNADGSAYMINKGDTTTGLSWELEDGTVKLSVYSYNLFDFTYDGEYLILSMGAKLYFEKIS